MPKLIALLFMIGVLAGCSTLDSSPLLFGQGVTVGISAGAAPTNTSPEIVVGFKQANFAVVPTVIPKDVPLPDSQERRIHAFGEDTPAGRPGAADALSTFGSFQNTTTGGKVGLGVFFATGVAAQNISEGFSCAVVVAENKTTQCPK